MTPRGRPKGRIPDGMCQVIDEAAFAEVIAQVFRFASPTHRGAGTAAAQLLACPRSLLYRYRKAAPAYMHPQLVANLLHFSSVAGGEWDWDARLTFSCILVPTAIDTTEAEAYQPTGTAVGNPKAGTAPLIDHLIREDLERARRLRGKGHQAAISAAALRVLIDAADVVCPLADVELIQRRLTKDAGKSEVHLFVYPWGEAALLNFVPSRRTAR